MILKGIAKKENKHQLMEGKAARLLFSEEHQNLMCSTDSENNLLGISIFPFNRSELNISNYFLIQSVSN